MIATIDLALRSAAADAVLWGDWMEAVRSIPGNPYGVDILTVGGATALHVHGAPVPYFNRIIGLSDGNVEDLDSLIDYFNERFTPCRVDVNPFFSGPKLLDSLNARSFHPSEFQTNLCMDTVEPQLVPIRGVQVREVRKNELDFFARLYERAYYGQQSPRRLAQFRMDSIKMRARREGWRFYLTLVDGVPAGGGALFVRDGVATLAGGATIYTLRGRGCQRALLSRRILDAAEAGCELVVSRCAVGSASQRNMERIGLRTVYTKSIWESRGLT